MWRNPHPGVKVLVEVGLLFLPGIPAYIWLWPQVADTDWLMLVQVLVYLYFLAGCVLIGRRRWNWNQLGLNRHGIGLSLICGAFLIAGRVLVTLSVDWPSEPSPITFAQLIGDIVFYVLLVGLIEELLFRGLIYQALDEWRGIRWAIWGSAFAFGVYHVGWQGIAALGALFIGVIFGVIRWQAGGIIGLIIVHGAMDVIAKTMLPNFDIQQWRQLSIVHPLLLIVGYVFLGVVPVYLWKFYRLREPQMSSRRLR